MHVMIIPYPSSSISSVKNSMWISSHGISGMGNGQYNPASFHVSALNSWHNSHFLQYICIASVIYANRTLHCSYTEFIITQNIHKHYDTHMIQFVPRFFGINSHLLNIKNLPIELYTIFQAACMPQASSQYFPNMVSCSCMIRRQAKSSSTVMIIVRVCK